MNIRVRTCSYRKYTRGRRGHVKCRQRDQRIIESQEEFVTCFSDDIDY